MAPQNTRPQEEGVVLIDVKCFYYYGYRGKKSELTFYGIVITVFDVLFFKCTISEATGKGYMSCKLDK